MEFAAASPIHVLIAHRDATVRALLRGRLSGDGFSVELAATDQEALELASLRQSHFEIVLADLFLSGVCARQFAQALARVDPTSHIVFLGSMADAQATGIEGRFHVVPEDTATADLQILFKLLGSSNSCHAPRILIADDDPTVRSYITDVLKSIGADVLEAENGQQAIEILQAYSADLLIIDLFMPEADGLETIQAIRRTSKSFRIIAISGAPDEFLKVARYLGADRILYKPLSPILLRSTVMSLLKPFGGSEGGHFEPGVAEGEANATAGEGPFELPPEGLEEKERLG